MSNAKPDSGITRHAISRADAFRVADWIRTNWPSIQQRRPTYTDLAERVFKETNINVVPANIQGIVADLGFTWHQPKRLLKNNGRNDRVRILASCVADLFKRLDEPVPEAVRAIVRGASPTQSGTEAEVNGTQH